MPCPTPWILDYLLPLLPFPSSPVSGKWQRSFFLEQSLGTAGDDGISLTCISQGQAEGQKYCHLCVCVSQAEGGCSAQATHGKRLTSLL